MSEPSKLRRVITWLAGGALLASMSFSALLLVAHTEAGKPLLHWMAKAAGCPVDLEGGDPAEVEAFRVQQLKQQMGDERATSHPALVFYLGVSTRDDVRAWATRVAADCKQTRKGSVLSCSAPAGPNELPIEDLHLQFDATDRLVAVDLFRSQGCEQDAVRHLQRLSRQLGERVGPATKTRGELNTDYLADSYRRAAFEYRYRDYRAQISATNLGARGIRVREQYQWAPPSG